MADRKSYSLSPGFSEIRISMNLLFVFFLAAGNINTLKLTDKIFIFGKINCG